MGAVADAVGTTAIATCQRRHSPPRYRITIGSVS